MHQKSWHAREYTVVSAKQVVSVPQVVFQDMIVTEQRILTSGKCNFFLISRKNLIILECSETHVKSTKLIPVS